VPILFYVLKETPAMNRLIFVLTCAASAVAAHAQSSVTIYGNMDAAMTVARSGSGTTLPGGVTASPASTRVTKLDSGIGPGSRLGFRGREDLGEGLTANFVMEMGMAVDSGALQQGGLPFGRQIYVGLAGKNWTLTAGRQYGPLDVAFGSTDVTYGFYWGNPVAASGHGLYASVGSAAGSGTFTSTARIDNSVQGTMNFGPVTAKLMLAAGNENTRGTGRLVNPAVAYNAGPVSVHASYLRMRQAEASLTATASPETVSEWVVGGTYDFRVAKLGAGAYEFTGPKNRANLSASNTVGAAGASPFAFSWDKTRTIWAGAAIPLSNSKLSFNISRVTYDYATGPDGSSTVIGGVYEYFLSKRTSMFASYGRVKNDSHSRTPLIATITAVVPNGFGSNPSAMSMGVRHQF
jgi:predicted porin